MVDVLSVLPMVLFLVGTGFILLEAVVPGAHSMVFGVGLFGAGMVGVFYEPANNPLALAALIIAFGSVAFYGYREVFNFTDGDGDKTLDSDSLAGAKGHVTKRVTDRQGMVELSGGGFSSSYSARVADGEDAIPEDAPIVVVDGGGGNIVLVKAREVSKRPNADN